MVNILRVRSVWSGFNGAPGYTNLFFRDFSATSEGDSTASDEAASGAVDRVRGFWGAISAALPDDVTITPEQTVDLLDDTNGRLIDSFTSSSGGSVVGGSAGRYSSASGAVVTWRTGGIREGRRIRGRTFIVPLAGDSYTTSGRLDPAVRQIIQTAANNLASIAGTPDLGVYARPSGPNAVDGQWSIVTGASVPDLPAILRSRRD